MKIKEKKEPKNINNYKVIISELKVNPFNMIKGAFALMAVIPLLVLFYILIEKDFLNILLIGNNSFIVLASIFISVMGFLYAYHLINNILKKLLWYAYERELVEAEKAELILGVSHDLRAPLAIIRSAVENMLDGIAGSINETQVKMMRLCLNSVKRITDFASQLLDISKLDFVRTNIKREYVNFAAVVKDDIDAIYELTRKNNQGLRATTGFS